MDDAAATGGRQLAPGLHALEDLGRGDWYETKSVTLTTDMIDRFAELSGDRFEIHMDAEAARRLGFADRVAHGLLVLSLVDGLKNQSDVRLLAVASLGWDWHFLAPVHAGDTISARLTVTETRPTSKPGRGIVTLAFDVTNQHGTIVQRGTTRLMMQARS